VQKSSFDEASSMALIPISRSSCCPPRFADFVESDFDLERVGEYRVRGFNDPIELFAYNG
jgi:hypothetical protein